MELNIYVYLGIALLLGLLASKMTKKIKLPNVTGYIIMGLIAGPYVLKLIPLSIIEDFSVISDIALGFIAFSIGGEFKLSYLKKAGKAPVVIAITAAVGAMVAVDLALMIAGYDIAFSLVLGAIAAATAPAATLMVVRQYKAKGPVTSTLLPVVAIDDAVALMLFGISVAIAKVINSTENISIMGVIMQPIIEIGGALLLGMALGMILTYLTRWFTGRGTRLSSAFAMVLVSIGLSTALGVSGLLTSMMMSAVYVNTSQEHGKVFELVDRTTPPLFILFFFISGAGLDIRVIPRVGVMGILYIVSRVIGKVLGSAIGAQISGAEPAVRKYLGYTLIPQAGVAIGLASIAMTAVPQYGVQIQTIVLSATVVYELVGPVITKIALKKAGEIEA